MLKSYKKLWIQVLIFAVLLVRCVSHVYGVPDERIPEEKESNSELSEDPNKPFGKEENSSQEKIQTYPGFQNLRYAENWETLKDSNRVTTFEKIKYIPLNKDGSSFFTLGGQIRLRGEGWWNFGFGGNGNRDDYFGLSRVRAHGDLRLGKHFRAFIEGKSSLATDRDLPEGLRALDVDTIDIQNALIDITATLEPVGLTFRLGRQELQYGKQRLVSPLDWANTRRTFDAAKGIIHYEKMRLEGFWSRYAPVKKYSFNTSHDSRTQLFGIYSTVAASKEYSLDLYWLGLDREIATFGGITGPERRHTFGARLDARMKESVEFDLEAAVQIGSHGDRNVRAALFGAQIGYQIEPVKFNPKLYTGLEFGSGDSDPTDDTLGTFNQLFPLAHAYLGFIDMIGRQNIVGWNSGFSFVPFNKLTVKTDVLFFWRHRSNDALYNAGGAIVRLGDSGDSKSVGTELDITLTRPINRHFLVVGGYSHFFPGSFIKESGASEGIDFTYLTLQFTF